MTDDRTAHDRADCTASMRGAARSTASAGIIVLALAAAAPAPTAAQTTAAIVGHVGRSAAVPGSAMIDIAGEVGQGPFAFRAGVGMDAAGTFFAPMIDDVDNTTGVWTADTDVGLALGRLPLLDRLVGRWHPAVFVGAGLAGVSNAAQDGDGGTSVVPTWSWGGRAGATIIGPLGFEAELRRRQTFADVSPEDYPVADDWEYRIGLALRFGGGGPRSTPRVAPGSRGGTTTGRGTRTSAPRRIDDTRRAASAAEIADRTIDFGERFIGTPYVWGGESPDGFDCSGFVQYVYGRHGISLPRVSRDQAHAGRALPLDDAFDALVGDHG
ncbi:MAG TPA: NlpC/P60 family protein, partial [Longimicrobiales bacterium]